MAHDWAPRTIPTPGGPFTVRERGQGDTVVLLHDEIGTEPGRLGDLLAEGHRVLAPVHPGFAGAERPGWVQSIRDVADHYLNLFEELELEEVTLVGASMGAWIALELALRLCDSVMALSLVAPVGVHVPGHSPADYWYVRDRDGVLFNDRDHMPELSIDDQVANEETAARYGWSPRLHDRTLAPRLKRVRHATQVVWSTGDRLLPAEHLDRWRELLPQAEVVEVDGVGHFPGREAPEETAALVTTFLSSLTTTGVVR